MRDGSEIGFPEARNALVPARWIERCQIELQRGADPMRQTRVIG